MFQKLLEGTRSSKGIAVGTLGKDKQDSVKEQKKRGGFLEVSGFNALFFGALQDCSGI